MNIVLPSDTLGGRKQLFGTIEKVEALDDGSVRVHGIASSEALDDQGEIVRASAMRAAIPEYMRFPALREMHQLSAAGSTLAADVDDDGNTRVIAHVVDPVAVLKVKNLVYRGFSIGGRITQREPGNPKAITGIVWNELSLVDRPACPDAIIDTWKIADIAGDDGMADPIGTIADTPAGEALKALVQPVQVWSCGVAEHQHTGKAEAVSCIEKRAAEGAAAAEDELRKAEEALVGTGLMTLNDPSDASERPPPAPLAQPTEPAAGGFFNASDAVAKADDKPKGDYGSDAHYADPGFQADKKPRYPLDTEERIRAAWDYINKPKNAGKYSAEQVSHIKSKIVAAWKDKIDSDGPPSAKKTTKRSLRKALEDTGQVASILVSLNWLADKLDLESAMEGDDSPQPGRLRAWIAKGCDFLNALVAEETGEIVAGTEIDPSQTVPIGLSANIGSLSKAAAGKVIELMTKMTKGQEAGHQMGLDVAAMAAKRAMGHATKKSDKKCAGNFCKAVLDAGATDLGAGDREMITDGNPVKGAGEATNHATQDTSHNAETTPPNPTGAVPSHPVPGNAMMSMKAVAAAAYIDGQMNELAKSTATASWTPYQKLMMIAHDAVKGVTNGATCKAGGEKPDYLSRSTMDDLDTAHYHFTKGRGLKCDMVAMAAKAAAVSDDAAPGTEDEVAKAGETDDLGKLELPPAFAKALQERDERNAAQNAEIAKAVASLAEVLGTIGRRVDDIAKQEMPPLTIAKGTTIAEKGGADTAGPSAEEIAAAIAKMRPEEIQLATLKGTFMNGPDVKLTERFGGRFS